MKPSNQSVKKAKVKIMADNRQEFALPDCRGTKIKGMDMIRKKVR
jgi:hypothetical protein